MKADNAPHPQNAELPGALQARGYGNLFDTSKPKYIFMLQKTFGGTQSQLNQSSL
jgi:hypothetical protein